MSEQELASAMNEAMGQNNQNDEQNLSVSVSDCIKVYDYVCSNCNLITNWKKMNIVHLDGTVLSDVHEVLIGIDDKNTPFSFACKNLMIPRSLVNDASEIKVFISGIIIKTPTSSVYVSKNNIFVYIKNTEGHTTESYVYYKVRGDKVSYKKNTDGSATMGTSEVAKLEFKVSGGRIYNIIQDMTDVNEIRNAILTFLRDKVVDINYCIKIENLCYRCGF